MRKKLLFSNFQISRARRGELGDTKHKEFILFSVTWVMQLY